MDSVSSSFSRYHRLADSNLTLVGAAVLATGGAGSKCNPKHLFLGEEDNAFVQIRMEIVGHRCLRQRRPQLLSLFFATR